MSEQALQGCGREELLNDSGGSTENLMERAQLDTYKGKYVQKSAPCIKALMVKDGAFQL